MWFARSLGQAAKKSRLRFLVTKEWTSLYETPEGEWSVMPWTRIGYVLEHLIESGKIDQSDCVPKYTTSAYFRPLRTVILPEFDHNLQKLAAMEQAKLNDLATLKAKVLAGLATAGISLGQAASQRLFPSHCCNNASTVL